MSDLQNNSGQLGGATVKAKKLRFCPYDGNLLNPKSKYCSRCRRTVNLQPMAPRKPRNFYEKMPEGVADNYTDDLFLKGFVHKRKSICLVSNQSNTLFGFGYRQFSVIALLAHDPLNS